MTDPAAREELERLRAAQADLLRAVSHDLRAPLRHVMSYGQLVRETLAGLPVAGADAQAQKEEMQGFLRTMDQSARRMGLMIDGLLALSRVAQAPLAPAPLDVARELPAVLAPLREQAQAQGRAVEWRIDVPPGLPPVWADAALWRQMLEQVLGNALKFTRGRAPAHIGVVAALRDAATLRIEVADDGAGFDPARAGTLFGVFQRLHREAEFEGVGAGLALCAQIAARHGAAIKATAQPGAGCTVTIDWPCALG